MNRHDVLNRFAPSINLTFFNVSSAQQLFLREHNARYIVDRPPLKTMRRFRRAAASVRNRPSSAGKERSADDAVMYMSLGGNQSPAEIHCPTKADSSAVSLAQMAFLSMTVSIFTVVASIANNINNNNNNNNDNNLNFVKQKTNSLSQNQNIVNVIDIDLPPPVPGRKKRSDTDIDRLAKMRDAFTQGEQITHSFMLANWVCKNSLPAPFLIKNYCIRIL